tara:strand:- start:24 stop:389 length:366 start_codon:yes stop_codon:yes gene_type:complete
MSKQDRTLNDNQLDAALDRLRPPVPSDTLVRRVHQMAPAPQRVFVTPRHAAAAALVMALGAAAMLHIANSGNVAPLATTAPPASIAAILDPAGEIPVSDVEMGDDSATPAESFSIAGMPLE